MIELNRESVDDVFADPNLLHRQEHTVVLKGHTWPVYSVAFSPDGKTLASSSWDKSIKLWDVATGKTIATPRGGR